VRILFLSTIATAAGVALMANAQDFPADELKDREIHRRATEAVLWGMPAVNTDLMLQQMLAKTRGKENQVIYWGRPLDWRNQTLTPNPDAIYFMAFFNTKTVGPLVYDIPAGDDHASLTGNIVTVWQTALEDVGLFGLDRGAGGKFVVLPPGYTEKIPDGYTPLPSDTYSGYALLRSNLKSHGDADVAASIAYGKRVKIYPLSAADNPPETVFTDVKDVDYDSTIRYDASFFDNLNRIVQSEPWIERDRAMIDRLRSIGIEKGKVFAPSQAMRKVLTAAIGEAKALLEQRYDAGFPPFYPKSHWTLPTLQEAMDGQSTTYANRDQYATDARALLYTYGYIAIKRPGTAQFYLISIRDKDGDGFDGAKTYRLHVPANAPVEQYWSVTAYDRQTHALIKQMSRASRASNASDVQKSADGSIDVYFGPKSPEGKEANWVPTDPQRGFELMFRVYGPRKAFFDKAWVLPDAEKVVTQTAIPVTVENFTRAESDMYFAASAKEARGIGKLFHHRDVVQVDNQPVVRANRDTLYSSGVFDLDAGPVTITMPEAGKRFMSLQAFNEDHYVVGKVQYGAGRYTFDRQRVGTRYMMVGIRSLVDPNEPTDVKEVHALQDAISIDQKSAGKLELPTWDHLSQNKVRDALLQLNETLSDTKRTFGTRDEVDPVRHLIGTAMGWGGNPEKEALYLPITPANNDGTTIHGLSVKDVPVDAFWSITVYNAEGYLQPNPYNAYSLNNMTAHKNGDGSVAVQFGGCNSTILNCLPIVRGWNYLVRLYRPRPEILNNTWKFPDAQPVGAGARALQ
jgi:hypothetical protein